MSSREKILSAIKKNQPDQRALPDMNFSVTGNVNAQAKFIEVLQSIGGAAHVVDSYEEIEAIIRAEYTHAVRIVSCCKEIQIGEVMQHYNDPHELENVDLAIVLAHFAVAENAAVWVTEKLVPQRVLPFIAQQLAVIVSRDSIFQNMHQAYQQIGNEEYGFATFIAGPSKTADIEQSLVLGAHGPKTMRVFIL
ncbi:MAG: LUD domain-containing protein [Agriterribacter sp.]